MNEAVGVHARATTRNVRACNVLSGASTGVLLPGRRFDRTEQSQGSRGQFRGHGNSTAINRLAPQPSATILSPPKSDGSTPTTTTSDRNVILTLSTQYVSVSVSLTGHPGFGPGLNCWGKLRTHKTSLHTLSHTIHICIFIYLMFCSFVVLSSLCMLLE